MKNIKEKGLSSAKVKYSVEPTVSENAEVNTFEECFGACYNKYQHDEKLMGSCIRGCQYRFGHNWDLDAPESKESEPIYTSEVLKNIGDNFHALADSVSILQQAEVKKCEALFFQKRIILTDYDRLSIHEFADAREKLHRLSIVLQDIIRNREGMLATGSYFYDNNYSSSSKIKKALQLDEHQLYSFIDVDDSEKLRS